MKSAIVTGASKGIGFEISKALIEMGYKVFGIGREFSTSEHENFIKIKLDITKTEELISCIKEIRRTEEIHILVNNAGVGYFGLHEELNPKKITQMVRTNFEAPLILTNLLLRNLKRNHGYIINISSAVAKKSATHGCVYGATKAGLTHFSNSLFDESRKYGIKITTIHPDMTKSDFYRNADFQEGDSDESYISSGEFKDIIKFILEQRTVITDITVKPQKNIIKKKPSFKN